MCCAAGSQELPLAPVPAYWHMTQPVTANVTETVTVWASEALPQTLTHTLTVMANLAENWPGTLTVMATLGVTWPGTLTGMATLAVPWTGTLSVMATLTVTWTGSLTGTLAGQEALLTSESVTEALAVAGLQPALARVSKHDVTVSH